jgi:hypothetical protein
MSITKSDHVYTIFATRNSSQFDQDRQIMRCKVLEAHTNYLIVESLKRYNNKYPDANVSTSGDYAGMPVRRVNKDQALVIIDESTNKWVTWETVRRREGTSQSPGRARGGK